METTVDINALRDGIIRDLKETKSLGMLEWIREMMDRVKETEKEENLEPYTMEELNARIDRAEAESRKRFARKWIAMNRSGLTRPRSSGHEFDAQRQKIRKARIGMTLKMN